MSEPAHYYRRFYLSLVANARQIAGFPDTKGAHDWQAAAYPGKCRFPRPLNAGNA